MVTISSLDTFTIVFYTEILVVHITVTTPTLLVCNFLLHFLAACRQQVHCVCDEHPTPLWRSWPRRSLPAGTVVYCSGSALPRPPQHSGPLPVPFTVTIYLRCSKEITWCGHKLRPDHTHPLSLNLCLTGEDQDIYNSGRTVLLLHMRSELQKVVWSKYYVNWDCCSSECGVYICHYLSMDIDYYMYVVTSQCLTAFTSCGCLLYIQSLHNYWRSLCSNLSGS